MNRFGSYTKLLKNGMQAIHAAIEIYNKPQLKYREEICTVLLINGWELALKATLSKNRVSIYQEDKDKKRQKKKENRIKPRTLEFKDALEKAQKYFPIGIKYKSVKDNLDLIYDYRNDIIHFYKEDINRQIIYGLTQTAIVNFRDIVKHIFNKDISKDINWIILPLSFSEPPNIIEYFSREQKNKSQGPLVDRVYQVLKDLDAKGIDTSCFLTQINIKLESVHKSGHKHVTVGIDIDNQDSTVISRSTDPNDTHPLLRKVILQRIRLNSYLFEAVAWKYKIKSQNKYCWKSANGGGCYQYSHEILTFLNQLSTTDFETARKEYSDSIKKR